MAQQTNYTIENGSGSAVRADINNVFDAINSSNSGTSAPSSAVPGSLWFDTGTSPASLRRRNASNTAWVEVNPDTLPAGVVRGNPNSTDQPEESISMADLKTMLGYSTSFGATSYTVTPDGTIIQYGSSVFTSPSTSVGAAAVLGVVTFPITFPNSARALIVNSAVNLSNGSEGIENLVAVQALSNSSGTFFAYRLAGGQIGSEQLGVYWVAIGN